VIGKILIKALFYPATSRKYTSNYDLAICYYNALKNNVNLDVTFFETSVVLQTGNDFDIIICFGSLMDINFDYYFLRNIQNDCSATLVWWLHDDPYELESNFRFVNNSDIVITNDETSELFYRPDVQTFFLPMAACEECYYKSLSSSLLFRFNFIGNAHPERMNFVNKLLSVRPQVLHQFDLIGTNWPDSLSNIKLKTSQEFSSSIYNRYLGSIDFQRSFFLTKNEFGLEASSPGPRPFQIALSGGTVIHVSNIDLLANYLPKDSYHHVTCESELIELFNELTIKIDINEVLNKREMAQKAVLANHTIRNRVLSFVEFLSRS
jgi:spore maturation protein CgeB